MLESSAADGTAVPIFISRNICLESAEIITVLKDFASETVKGVFPEAVGPAITTRLFILLIIRFKLKQEFHRVNSIGIVHETRKLSSSKGENFQTCIDI